MAVEVIIPALASDGSEANLARWLKGEGEAVKAGDVIAEVETDKAIVEVTAICDGMLSRILVPAGSTGVRAEQVIALLLEKGESDAPPAPVQRPQVLPEPIAAQPAPAHSTVPAASIETGGRVFASPRARSVAAQAGLNLSRVVGSGPHGRIVKADVEAVLGRDIREVSHRAVAHGSESVRESKAAAFTELPHSMTRRTIARRLTQAKQEAPHYYLSIDCNIDALLKVRQEINAGRDADKVSVNDFVIRAAALALKKVPAVNASWTESCIRQHHAVDVSVAVAAPGGLVTPVVRSADSKSVKTIAVEIKRLAARARQGRLTPEEYQGGTFSVSNLGMYGIREFTAVINPPQSAILAIGAGEPRPVVDHGTVVIATIMACTLSADHRVVDGAVAAEFLACFKNLIEEPRQLLLQ